MIFSAMLKTFVGQPCKATDHVLYFFLPDYIRSTFLEYSWNPIKQQVELNQ
jgi:hypothetical protein